MLTCSYGSGSGRASLVSTVTDRIAAARDKAPGTRAMLEDDPVYLEYGAYAKYRGKILKAP